MRRILCISIVVFLLTFAPYGGIADSFQKNITIGDFVEVTVYDDGTFTGSGEIRYHYPTAGGMLLVQVASIGSTDAMTPQAIYDLFLPNFISSLDKGFDNVLHYKQTPFLCQGYTAKHYQLTWQASGIVGNSDLYCIIGNGYIVSLMFADTDKLGTYPKESIPYILASLHYLDN